MKPTFLYHLLTLALLLCGMVMPSLQAQPYKNPSLSPEERTADLLQRMTLEEKIAQIRHIHSWNIFEEQELNKSKLQEFVGDLCWGFVEGFPLIGENCHRFYIDEVYQFITHRIIFGCISRPIAWWDRHVVDGFFDFLAWGANATSDEIRGLQSGRIQQYTFVFLLGTLALILLLLL